MKNYILLVLLVLVVAVSATADPHDPTTDIYQQQDTTQQENSAFNAPTSAMSNVQINPYSNARDYYGNGVSCSKPSVNIGLAGGERPHKVLGYLNVNIPLGMKDCKKVANTRKQTMEYQLYQMKTEQRKADVLFAAKMANMCLEISSHITITPDNPLYTECAQYVAIEPTPDEIAALATKWNQTSQRLNARMQNLEHVAHRPNESFLINR